MLEFGLELNPVEVVFIQNGGVGESVRSPSGWSSDVCMIGYPFGLEGQEWKVSSAPFDLRIPNMAVSTAVIEPENHG